MSAKDVFCADTTMGLRGTLFLSFLFTASTCLGQHYPILPVAGSPQGIFTMMQDSRSALWLGTIDDVYCFDGEHFYSLRQYGFPKETPNGFAEDSEGGIWIGTQGTAANGGSGHGGLYRYRSGRVQRIFSGDSLSIVAVAHGKILASFGVEANGKPTYGDLYLFHESGPMWVRTRVAEQQAHHLSVDHQGNALFPCPGGWCEIAQQQLMASTGPNDHVDLVRHEGSPLLEKVIRDRYGCLWFRTEAFASYQCASDKQPLIVSKDISEYDSSAHLEEASDGSIFMLVKMALGRPGSFRTANVDNGLPENLDTALVARDGTIWIGTASGLYRFMYPFRIESWGKSDGIAEPLAIVRTEAGSLFTSDGHVAKFDSRRNRWDRVPDISAVGLLSPGPDKTLFGFGENRVLQFDAQGIVRASGETPANSAGDLSLATSPSGEVLLGLNGVSRVVRRDHDLVLKREPLPERSSGSIVYDGPHETLWACNGGDIAFRKAGVWGRITQQDGLLDAECKRIAVDQVGDIWMGYATSALAWIRSPASGHPIIKNYTRWLDQTVQNGGNHILSFDRRGWLWSGTDVLHLATSEAAKAGDWVLLNETDGLAPPQVGSNAFLADLDGSVWFGTAAGVTHFLPPPDFLTTFSAPPVFVAGLSSAQSGPTIVDAITSVPRDTDVTAHIGSLQFDRRNAIHLRYRLLPEQSNWQSASSFDLALGKLHWGAHRLQVQAQLSTGPWSEVSEESFTVLKPLWITWPAIAGYLVAFFSGAFGIRTGRKHRAMRAKKKFPELANWRLAALTPEPGQLAGTVIDSRFEVGIVLAKGGFATVLEGRDLDHDRRPCAIKIFRQELMDKDWLARRFQQEVNALAKIDHPNVVRIFSHGATIAGTPYLVMEFIAGRTLREALEGGSIAPRTTAGYLRQIGSALDAIHGHGICHRDLKPENLMIRDNGVPGQELVLIDFSIAIVKDPDETMHGLSRAAGTLYYMAPEQAIGYADPATDIYSLAKVVIEMLTGRRLSDLLPNASMDLSARVRELLGGLSIRLSTSSIELLSCALEFDPARRPRDAGRFAGAIADNLER